MKSRYISILAAAAMISATATAQVTREIKVERIVVPQERPACRISLPPSMVQPKFEKANLKFSDRAIASAITPMSSLLEPATTDMADSLAINQRGYLDLGYFPTFNLGLSAGYKIVSTNRTNVNAWLQYDGNKYKRHDLENKRNTFTIAVGADHRLTDASGIDLSFSYTYDATKWQQTWSNECEMSLNSNRLGLDLGYHGQAAAWNYGIALQTGLTTASLPKEFCDPKHQSEVLYGLKGQASYDITDNSSAGVRLNWLMRSEKYDNNPLIFDGLFSDPHSPENTTMGTINVNPYWRSAIAGEMNVELGLNADFAINSGTVANFAPQAILSWSPRGYMKYLAMEVKATGGLHANTLASLLDYSTYILPSRNFDPEVPTIYGNSHIPYDFAAKITVGPFSGAYVELEGNYAKANDWMMPAYVDHRNCWISNDVKGWMLGVRTGYKFRNLAEVSVAYQHASSDDSHAYYRWRDGARHVMSAQLTVNPIKPLTAEVGFDARWGRRTIARVNVPTAIPEVYDPQWQYLWLGASRNLWLGAAYRFTPQFSVFARGENLLGNDSQIVYGVSEQGVKGLVGVQYIF